MPENVETCAEKAAKLINEIPANKRELATRFAETFAAGIAVGSECAETGKEEKKE